MNSKITFVITVFVISLFVCAQIGECAPASKIPTLTKESTNNPNPESASQSSSNQLGNTISPLNNEPEIFGVLEPSQPPPNRVSDHSQNQIKVPILTRSYLADLYNDMHGTQLGDIIKTAGTEEGADGNKKVSIYNWLSESELGEYSESYEGGSVSQSESVEDDDGDGDIFIDCGSSGCSEVDEMPSEDMLRTFSRIGDDDETITSEELDVMFTEMLSDIGDLATCVQLYKYRLAKNATRSDNLTKSRPATFNKVEVFSDILQCKIWIGTLRSVIDDMVSKINKRVEDMQSNLKSIGSISTTDPGPVSRMQQLPTEDHDEDDDDEDQALSVLFASDLQYGITTVPTLNEDSAHPEKAALENSSNMEEQLELASEPIDLKPPTLSFDEPPKDLLQNEDADAPENETLILIIEQGINDDTAAQSQSNNPKKNLFHPLLIFPILVCSLIFSCILGTAYNKYLGRSEDKTKILKVPRMAIFSDAPLNSILFPSVTEGKKVHSMKKQGIEVV